MDYDNGFILQKAVDWSLLNDGMTIPVSVCSLFRAWDEDFINEVHKGNASLCLLLCLWMCHFLSYSQRGNNSFPAWE